MPHDRQATRGNGWLTRLRPALILLILAIVIVCVPILARGLASGGDLVEHIKLTTAYRDSISRGELLPDWTLDNLGRGSTSVRVYPPVMPLTTAAVWLVVGDLYWALAICLTFWLFASMLGTFFLVRDLAGEKAALIGAIACGLAPHHLALIFKFSFYAEFAALGILPFCFVFLRRLFERNRWTDTVLLSISVSLLILTHLPMSVIGIPILLMFGIGLRPGLSRVIECSRNLSVSVVITLILTSVFWLRWINEREWIAHFNDRYTEGLFSFEKWLFPIGVFVERAMPRVPGTLFSYAEFLLTAAPVIAGLVILFFLWRGFDTPSRRIFAALVFSGSACAFMITWLSYPVWISIGVIRMIQFPFRFLTVLSFIGGAIIALWIGSSREFTPRLRAITLLVLTLLAMATLAFDTRMVFFNPYTKNAAELKSLAAELEDRPGPPWWLPVNAANDTLGELPTSTVSGGRFVEITEFRAEQRSFTVFRGSQADRLDTATYYYPYWKVKVNDRPVQPDVDANGVMIVPVSDETSEVNLAFSEPLIYRIAKLASLIGWIAVLAALGLGWRSSPVQDPVPPSVQ